MSKVQVVKLGKGLNKDDMESLQATEGVDDLFEGSDEAEETEEAAVEVRPELKEIEPIIDSAARRGLIMKISSYKTHERIGRLLKDHKISRQSFNIETLSMAELEGLLEDVKLHVSAKNSTSFNSMAFDIASSSYENVMTQYTPYNLTGFSSVINSKHPEIQLALDELTLEYQSFVHIPPQYRLLSVVLLATVQISAANENGIKIGPNMDKPVNNHIRNRYADL